METKLPDFYPPVFSGPVDPEDQTTFWVSDCPRITGILTAITENVNMHWCPTSASWWLWHTSEGIWVQHEEHSVRQWLTHLCHQGRIRYEHFVKGKPTEYLAIRDGVASFERTLRDYFALDMVSATSRTNPIWVGFADADVEFRRGIPGKQTRINPDHYVTYRLPLPVPAWLWDPINQYGDDTKRPTMTCSVIDDIVRIDGDVKRSEAQARIVWTYWGATLCDGSSALQRIFTLVGEKGTGKSVILDLAQKWVPDHQIAAVQPAELGERFGTSALVGKRVNLVDDIEETDVTKTGKIKSLVQGKGVGVEYKGGKHEMVRFDRMIHMYSSNEKGIRTPGANEAIYDRFAYVRCPNHIRHTKKDDPKIVEKMWAKESREIMEFALATYLTVVKERWFQGDLEDSSHHEVVKMVATYNRFGTWINDVLIPGDAKSVVRISALTGAYGQYKTALRYHDRITTEAQIIDALPKQLQDAIERKQVRVPGGGREWTKVLVGYTYQPVDLNGDPNAVDDVNNEIPKDLL